MAILDQLRNDLGVQTLRTGLSRTNVQARAALLAHTDGNLYAVWSEAYTTGTNKQILYFSKSADIGITWDTPIELTSSNFDDAPAIIQLNLASTSSNIGIVFHRLATYDDVSQPVVNTLEVTTAGVVASGPTPLTGSPEGRHLCVAHTATGYVIAFIANASRSNAVRFYTNVNFSTGVWALSNVTIFPTNQEAFSLSLKRLANGDHALIAAYRTGLNGTLNSDDELADNLKTDVGVCFSADNCATWTTVQNLTSYAGSAGISADGLTCVANADLVQLSDNTVVVLFSEYKAAQIINPNTTPALTSGNEVVEILHHDTKGYILVAADNTTNGGLFVINPTSGTITRIYTGSTPALSDNRIRHMALSSDDKYIALATQTGIAIIDTTDSTIANWTVTNVGTPTLLVGAVAYVKFDGATDLFFAYDTSSGLTDCFGGKLNASSPVSVTNILVPSGFVVGTPTIRSFDFAGASIIYGFGTKVGKSLKSTGAGQYYVDLGASNSVLTARHGVLYDDLNGEIIAFGQNFPNHLIKRITDSGSALTVAETFNSSSTPAAVCNFHQYKLPGIGILINAFLENFLEGVTFFYSFGDKKPTGIVSQKRDSSLGDHWIKSAQNFVRLMKSSSLLGFAAGTNTPAWIDINNTGRLRYGFFSYNTVTHQLTTSGVDFYDVVNGTTVGAAYKKLRFPRVVALQDNTLVIIANKMDLSQTTKQFTIITGEVGAAGATTNISAKASISKTSSTSLSVRAKIGTITTNTFSARARIVFATTLSIRARISEAEDNRTSSTISTRAHILGQRVSILPVEYTVATTRSTRLRFRYYVTPGAHKTRKVSIKARIIRTREANLVGHFIVKMPVPTVEYVNFEFTTRNVRNFTCKARIVK